MTERVKRHERKHKSGICQTFCVLLWAGLFKAQKTKEEMASLSRKKAIAVWKPVRQVQLKPDVMSGAGEFSIENFTTGKVYEVSGVTFKVYSDRSNEFCYLIKDDTGALVLKSTSKFEVVDDVRECAIEATSCTFNNQGQCQHKDPIIRVECDSIA